MEEKVIDFIVENCDYDVIKTSVRIMAKCTDMDTILECIYGLAEDDTMEKSIEDTKYLLVNSIWRMAKGNCDTLMALFGIKSDESGHLTFY